MLTRGQTCHRRFRLNRQTRARFPARAPLTVGAIGSPLLRYRWFSNNIALGGATNSSLSFPSVQPNHAANYFVTISNSVGVVTSEVASLVVVNGQVPLKLIEFTNVWRYNLSGAEL